jgi:hypothetical protein
MAHATQQNAGLGTPRTRNHAVTATIMITPQTNPR